MFGLIAEAGPVPATTMYATFNMGTGFCVVVSPDDERAATAALSGAGEEPLAIGLVSDRPGHEVSIPSLGLRGRGDAFAVVHGTV